MRSMWSVEVVEALPDGQLLLEIDIVFVGEDPVLDRPEPGQEAGVGWRGDRRVGSQ